MAGEEDGNSTAKSCVVKEAWAGDVWTLCWESFWTKEHCFCRVSSCQEKCAR